MKRRVRDLRVLVWGRVAVAILTLTVAFGAALPAYARLFAGAKAHVCHCESGSGHAHCACPICFPELEVDLSRIAATVTGRCGDDEAGWRTYADPAIVPPALGSPSPVEHRLVPTAPPELRRRPFEPPDPRPPRRA